MKKNLLILFIMFSGLSLNGQSTSSIKENKENQFARFVGNYEADEMAIQFALQNGVLILIVPGAPIQPLEFMGKNKFKSLVFKDQNFVFIEREGKVIEVISEGSDTIKAKKTDDEVEILSMKMDSLLVMKKSSEHFVFLYSDFDSIAVDSMIVKMEKNYARILRDFKLERIPTVTVRIYPDLKSFHKGINFPAAPDQVLATAFGKDDIRMVSSRNAGPEGWMMDYAAPHEFTHIVHLNIDYSPNNPTWLWEGVAQYEAAWFFNPNEFEFMRKKEFPSLSKLNNGMEYMLGYVIIESIKDLWGFDTVISLIENQGDVQKVLRIDKSLFEKEVYEHIYEKYIQTK